MILSPGRFVRNQDEGQLPLEATMMKVAFSEAYFNNINFFVIC